MRGVNCVKWYVVGVEAALISVNHSVLRVYIAQVVYYRTHIVAGAPP